MQAEMKLFFQKYVGRLPSYLVVAIFGWLSKILFAVTQLISIPVFYHRLGTREFAVFVIMTSLNAWYNLFDLGIGSSLQNYISEYRANNRDPAKLLTIILPVIVVLLIFFGMVIFIFGGIVRNWLFHSLPNQLSVFNFDMNVFLYTIYGLLLIGNKVLFAYQKGSVSYFYQSIGYMFLLLVILVIYLFHILLTLNQALYCWIIPLFTSGVMVFYHAFSQAKFQPSCFFRDRMLYKEIMIRAAKFWFLAFSTNGVLAIDYLIIVKLLSDKDIIVYSFTNKIFAMLLFIYSAVLSALWPVLSEKYAKQTIASFQAAEAELRKVITAGLFYIILATIALIFFRNFIVEIFKVKQAITLPIMLLVIFGVYACVRVYLDAYTTALQARNQMKLFIYLTPLQAVIAIISMISMVKFGLEGLMLALTFSFVVIPVWLVPYFHYQSIKSFLKKKQ
jgi:O-antigen/teichoic acid export membrane protein